MPSFNKTTVVPIVLDEYDTLVIAGLARLQITVGTRPQYETVNSASLTYGPFGLVTIVMLNGLGDGMYTTGQSNVRVPMALVDLSAAQIASPGAAFLADTATLYQLNGAPYTIYQSNGSALVALGSGGGGGDMFLASAQTVTGVKTFAAGAALVATAAQADNSTKAASTAYVDTLGATKAGTTAFTSVAAGLVPASGGGATNFLRADGTFAAPAGGAGLNMTPDVVSTTTYTLVAGDSGKNKVFTNAAGCVITANTGLGAAFFCFISKSAAA